MSNTAETETAPIADAAAEPADAAEDQSEEQLIAAAAEYLEQADSDEPAPEPGQGQKSPQEQGEQQAEAGPEDGQEPAQEQDASKEEPIGDVEPKRGSRGWEHAQLRRQQQQLARQQADFDARSAKLAEAEAAAADNAKLVELMKLNPIKAAEAMAEKGGLRGDQFLQRLQEAYVKGDDGGQAEVRTELAQIREEIAAWNKSRAEAAKEQEQQQQQETLQEQQTQWVDKLIATTTNGSASRYQYLAAAIKTDPEDTRRVIGEAVKAVYENDWNVSPEDLLDHLDKQEKTSHGRFVAIQQHLNGARGQGNPAVDESANPAGQGSPASAQKPAANQRTVTNHDVANSSGARRELSEAEALIEADRVLRGS